MLGRRADNSIEASLIRVDGASGAEIVFTVETDLDLDDEELERLKALGYVN